MKRQLVPLVACAALVASSLMVAAPASAHDRGHGHRPPPTPGPPTTLIEGLTTPLSLEVDRRGTAYVSQDFAGLLTRVDRDGTPTNVVTAEPGQSVGSVSTRRGNVFYSQTGQDPISATLNQLDRDGESTVLADLRAYEEEFNPDQVNTYGFVDLPQECIDQFNPDATGQEQPVYTGLIDSNPYASLALKDAVYVADAGANAILRVGYDGVVSTVAVLPPAAPIVVSAELAAQLGFPACSAGFEYRTEPVPTDVELGPDGHFYVTSLPGGPEDPSLGARGSVFKIAPWDGEVEFVATGFGGATGLAVSERSGTIYVAELFGGPEGTGQVSVLTPGSDTPTPLLALPTPAAIELRKNSLYVTTNAIGDPSAPPEANGAITVVPLESSRGKHQEDSHDEG